jgi:putative transposase
VIKTLKLRVKDKHAKELGRMARDVNFIWNYINELSHRSITERGRWLSAFDFNPYLKGAHAHFDLTMQSLKEVALEYVIRRQQARKNRLRWRSKRSLGWVPFSTQDLKIKDGKAVYRKKHYSLFNAEYLNGHDVRTGSFNQDARGRWYLNVTVKVEPTKTEATGAVGLDLGLKSTVTDSNGGGIEGRNFRKLEDKLARHQRANNRKQVRNVHAKTANRRKHEMHVYTTQLVRTNVTIVVGSVKLDQSKSTMDAGWYQLKSMLSYKCAYAGVDFREVNEAYSTVTCSACGSLTGPTGLTGLRIRNWYCSDCGTHHDRDVNAAKNILSFGVKSGPLAGEITTQKRSIEIGMGFSGSRGRRPDIKRTGR